MNFSKKFIPAAAMASLFALSACGESSTSSDSNGEQVSVQQDSSSTRLPEPTPGTDSLNQGGNGPLGTDSTATDTLNNQGSAMPTQDSLPPLPAILSFEEEMARDSLFVAASADTGITFIEDVYKNLAADERVIFLIRHSRRFPKTEKETQLTTLGIQQAQLVGEKLKSNEPFAYAHTDFVRTQQTAENIAIGRGETFPGSTVIPELTETWYTKDEEKLAAAFDSLKKAEVVYSEWAFHETFADAFYDLKESSVKAITELLIPKMSATTRVNVVVSHDMFIGPLIVYCTNKQINRLRYWETRRWVFFLSGLAIVIKPDGTRRYIPIDGIEYGS